MRAAKSAARASSVDVGEADIGCFAGGVLVVFFAAATIAAANAVALRFVR